MENIRQNQIQAKGESNAMYIIFNNVQAMN